MKRKLTRQEIEARIEELDSRMAESRYFSNDPEAYYEAKEERVHLQEQLDDLSPAAQSAQVCTLCGERSTTPVCSLCAHVSSQTPTQAAGPVQPDLHAEYNRIVWTLSTEVFSNDHEARADRMRRKAELERILGMGNTTNPAGIVRP